MKPRPALLALALAAGCAHEAPAPAPAPRPAGRSAIVLDGAEAEVRWSDGDSFEVRSGPLAGTDVRLVGYNTLESYGPVHRWGSWTPRELYEIARTSKDLASARTWTCTSGGKRDAYRRLLVSCPDAALALVEAGHAFAFAVDDPPDPALLAAQRRAIEAKVGIWAKGAPAAIVTSVHPAKDGKPAYDRVVDLATGTSRKVEHGNAYGVCEEVCPKEAGGSCMVHVPFESRYENRPDCLR